jgi:hypothetical protein
VETADLVISGTVIRVDAVPQHLDTPPAERVPPGDAAVTVLVTERWRGARADTAVVHTGGSCGPELRVGTSYFIVANRRDPEVATSPLVVWPCGQTRPIAAAGTLRQLLGRPSRR